MIIRTFSQAEIASHIDIGIASLDLLSQEANENTCVNGVIVISPEIDQTSVNVLLKSCCIRFLCMSHLSVVCTKLLHKCHIYYNNDNVCFFKCSSGVRSDVEVMIIITIMTNA